MARHKKRLLESEYFGEQLKKDNLIKDILSKDIKTKNPISSRADEILKYVQNNYTWNKETGIFTEKGIRNLLSTKTGNVAEINLLLIMLLRNAGIPTDPLILPTLDRGKLTSYSPSITVPNYLLAAVNIDGKYTLFDATSKHSSPNIIPPRGLNYNGILLDEKEAKIVEIFYPDLSQTVLTVEAELNPDGTFKGSFSDKDTKLFGLMANELFDKDKEDFVKSYKDKYKFKLSNIDSHTVGEDDFETTLNFTSDSFVDNIGGKMVFNPLLFLYTQEHDFSQKEERKSPIEFLSGNERIKKVTISLPENYIFESIPTSKKFRTEDNSIIYSYKINKINESKIVVETSTLIDAPTFPKEYYTAFKQIFDNITKLEGQVVTVIKKK